ncbi:MAG: TolC family protein [Candidatus Omnitrophica bacterium]|nr:TolC family protein [Candidatus Omnitrophota bacterium]HOX54067.1 TolC family protein [Candidatus Omnitrophota bacterium]
MKKVIMISILGILIFANFSGAEEVIPLTLDEAIAIALRDNRDILLGAESVKKAKLKIADARSSLYPSFTLSSSLTSTNGLYSSTSNQTANQATLKQYLYKGGKTINTIKYNEYNFEVSQALLDKTKLDTIFNVTKTFYTLLLAEDFAKINEQILENTKEHLAVVEARFQNGQASESDILAIKESLSSVEQVYQASQNEVESVELLLKNLLYLDDKIKIQCQGQFSYEPRDVAIDEALLTAMKIRPEIKQYEAQEKANKAAIEMAKADNRPSVYASWDYYSRSHTAGTNLKNWNDYNIIGLTVSWPIFDGWATKSKVEQAIVDLKQTQLTKEKIIKDIALEIKNAYINLKDAVSKIKSTESEFAVYQDNLSVVNEKYGSGIASSLDLDDANLKYGLTEFNKKQAIYDYIIAKESLNKAKGEL